MKVGFLGLGIMGKPMALNVVGAGFDLVVWNRSAPALEALERAGAKVAGSAAEVCAESEVVLTMLANGAAIDAALAREDKAAFGENVAGRIIVHLGTTDVAYTKGLSEAVAGAGGRFVEAPVSGSKVPAENGALVGMVAGPEEAIAKVEPVLSAMCRTVERCGPVPNATLMKLAVNTYLLGLMGGLIEGAALAHRGGLDMEQFGRILEAGPMANALMSMKLPKLLARDFSDVQGQLTDAIYNQGLIVDAAENQGLTPAMIRTIGEVFAATLEMGYAGEDFTVALEAYLAGKV